MYEFRSALPLDTSSVCYPITMLGWHITVYRQKAGGDTPAVSDAPTDTAMAVWQTGIGGLNWIDALVEAGMAICLSGNGYPTEYTAKWEHLKAPILNGPPDANRIWRHDPGDVLTEKWLGATTIDHEASSECPPDEWVLIQAWDES